MKTTRVLAIVVIAAALPRFAAAEPLKLKAAELTDLGNSLAVVADGGVDQVVDQGGQAGKKVARIQFEYTGKVRFTLVRNLTAIRAELAKLDEVRTGLIKETGVKEGATMTDPARIKFEAKWAEVREQPITIDLIKLAEADLNLERNQIPGTTLTFLAPLINELAPALAQPPTQVAKK